MANPNRRHAHTFRFTDVILTVVIALIVYDLLRLVLSALVAMFADALASSALSPCTILVRAPIQGECTGPNWENALGADNSPQILALPDNMW